jgi:hypothetical protein
MPSVPRRLHRLLRKVRLFGKKYKLPVLMD